MQPKTDFAIIPDRESIASVDRDIRFFPSETKSPQDLSLEQIETWNRDGYLGPLDVYSKSESRASERTSMACSMIRSQKARTVTQSAALI